MENKSDLKRLIVFCLFCIPVRIALIWAAFNAPFLSNLERFLLVTFTALVGAGLVVSGALRVFGLERPVGFAGGEVYWSSFAHGAAYLVFVVLFVLNVRWAWAILLVDLAGGSVGVLNHYHSSLDTR